MKPSIEREIEAVRQMVRDLESRLKVESVPLGHRIKFGIGVQGEVPAPQPSDNGRVLGVHGWFTITGSGGGGSGTPDGHTLAIVTGVLNAEPLSGTIDAALKNLSGTIDGRFNNGGSSVLPDGHTTAVVTGVLNAEPLSGTINARFKDLTGSLISSVKETYTSLQAGITSSIADLSGTVNSAFVSLWTGGTRPQDLSGSIDSEFKLLSSSIVNTIQAVSGGTNMVNESYTWAGGRTSYQGAMPLIVGGVAFNPHVYDASVGTSATFHFLASAACNRSDVKAFAQLWNLTDGYQVATASFSGTPKADLEIPLSVHGSGNVNIPDSLKDYEVRIYVSGTSGQVPAGSSVELYSSGIRARVSGIMGGLSITTDFSGSIAQSFAVLSGTIDARISHFNDIIFKTIGAAEAVDPTGAHARSANADYWTAGSTAVLIYPLTLDITAQITGYTLYVKKTGAGTLSTQFFNTNGANGTITSEGGTVNDHRNNPGFTTEGLAVGITITAGKQYWLQVTPGDAGDLFLHLEIGYRRVPL